MTTRPVSSSTSRASPSRTVSPRSITPPGGVHSRVRSLRRLLTSTRPPSCAPPTRGINAPPTTQFLIATSAAFGSSSSPSSEVIDPQLDDDDQRLAHDPARHLRRAGGAVRERDRELAPLPADPHQAVRHLDLEAVALGGDRVELHALERVGAIVAGPRRGIVDGQSEHTGRVPVTPP